MNKIIFLKPIECMVIGYCTCAMYCVRSVGLCLIQSITATKTCSSVTTFNLSLDTKSST